MLDNFDVHDHDYSLSYNIMCKDKSCVCYGDDINCSRSCEASWVTTASIYAKSRGSVCHHCEISDYSMIKILIGVNEPFHIYLDGYSNLLKTSEFYQFLYKSGDKYLLPNALVRFLSTFLY